MSTQRSRHSLVNPRWRVKPGAPARRMRILLVGFVTIGVVLALRCVYVQGLDLAGNAGKALMPESVAIPATRGTIYDRNGSVLAESVPAVNITADPTIVAVNGMPEPLSLASRLKAQAGPGIIAGILTAYLGGDYQDYYDKLTRVANDAGDPIRYVMVARNVLTYNNLPVAERLDSLGYVGLYREQAPVRNYPNGTVAANVLGFMTFSDQLESEGKYPWTGGDGLEYQLNSSLAGIDGQEIYEWSPYGRIPTGTSVVKDPQEGISYQLTLDSGLQYMQDQRLAAAVEENGARAGMAITMSVNTGEILAMSTYPTFDPNDPGSSTAENLGDRLVRDTYEPGSVEKVLTMAALVDQGLAAPDTRVIVPGQIESGGFMINDAWWHETLHLTAAGIIAQSSNIGTIVLTRQATKESLVDYLTSFGLGSPTGIGLPGEEPGYLPDADMTDQTRDNIAFGQGLAVTAVQEAAAVNAVANGGVYVSPTIIKSATTSDGKPVDVPASTSHRVVSSQTSSLVLEMMEQVPVANPGYFEIDGYRTAAKSGTAQAIDPSCGCYRGNVVSYIGVAPAENPKLLTYVVLDHPSNGASGTSGAAPVVHDVMSVALPRYAAPTSTTPTPDLPLRW